MTPDAPDAGEAVVPPGIDQGTVEALVETVRALLHDEDSREQSLTTRAVGISGFAALILSLAGFVSSNVLYRVPSGTPNGQPPLSDQWKLAVLILLVAALGLLLSTIVVAVVGVLIPKEYATISMREVERYPTRGSVSRPRVMVQGSTLVGLVDALASERSKNSTKAGALSLAYWLLLAGLVGVTALAAILALHGVGVI